MLNIIDFKIRPKFLDEIKNPYKEVDIQKIVIEALYIIINILTLKKLESQTNLVSIPKLEIWNI